MTPHWRPIHMPGAAAFDWARQRAQAALDAWAREWVSGWLGDERRITTLQVFPASDALQRHAHEYQEISSESGRLWVRCSSADRSSFSRAVVGSYLMQGSACADDWVAGVIDSAWDARSSALCSALLGAPISRASPSSAGALPPGLFAFGSGAVQLSCEELGLHAIADSSIWRTVPPNERDPARRLPKLVPLDQAAHGAMARLDVLLGSVEVELPKLLDLRDGDVLRLPQRLDQGITVHCEGKPLGRAVLGETQGLKSVQVFSEHQ